VRILKSLEKRFFGKRNEDSEVRNIKELDGADGRSISRPMVAQNSNYVKEITIWYTQDYGSMGVTLEKGW